MGPLRYLDLTKSDITTLPEVIGKLVELEYLNLSSTSLESLPMALGNLKNLKYLHCKQEYEMKNIPHALIRSLAKLKILDLFGTFCEVEYLDDVVELKLAN